MKSLTAGSQIMGSQIMGNPMTAYNLTPQDFKSYFKRGEFIYPSPYDEGETYKKGNVVYLQTDYYKSLTNDNINNDPFNSPDYWELLPEGELFVWDDDIDRAFIQAGGNFNPRLFAKKEEDLAKVCFLMLTAHYIVQDYNMISGNNSAGIMTSKSIGEASASYSIPEAYLKNPFYSYLANTPYGLKYLSYICGRTIGNVGIAGGRTNF